MVTLLNQTSILDWYLARLVIKNAQKKKTCVTIRLDCVLKICQLLTELGGSLWLLKEKENLQFDLRFSLFLRLNFDSKPWNDTLRDSQLLTRWGNSRSNRMPQIVCGVGIAHNRTTYLTTWERESSHRNRLGWNSFHKNGTQVTPHDSKFLYPMDTHDDVVGLASNCITKWASHFFHPYNT